MCDHHFYNSYCCQNNFYNQYIQEHAAMMQWIQHLHQNIDRQSVSNDCQTCHFDSPCCRNSHYSVQERNYVSQSSSSSSESCSSSSYSSDAESKEDSSETYVDDESDCEFELNVDAILAMRAAKEEMKKTESSTESSSVVLIDSDKEDFEFIELGSLRTLEPKQMFHIGNKRNRYLEMQTEKKVMEYLYGERCTTIAGLETAMSVNFEHLCDIHQPPLWPVLPVRL